MFAYLLFVTKFLIVVVTIGDAYISFRFLGSQQLIGYSFFKLYHEVSQISKGVFFFTADEEKPAPKHCLMSTRATSAHVGSC